MGGSSVQQGVSRYSSRSRRAAIFLDDHDHARSAIPTCASSGVVCPSRATSAVMPARISSSIRSRVREVAHAAAAGPLPDQSSNRERICDIRQSDTAIQVSPTRGPPPRRAAGGGEGDLVAGGPPFLSVPAAPPPPAPPHHNGEGLCGSER